jgi:glycosyltransferase involved in cell wall biosynthesis
MARSPISIIIPTYRESSLAAELEELVAHLATLPREAEVIVVDDSPIAERPQLEEVVAHTSKLASNVTVTVTYGQRTGKGGAVRIGALAATGKVVLTMDADLPVPLVHIEEFVSLIENGAADIVIGERPFDRNLSTPLRFVLSRALFVLQRTFIFHSSEFLDTQCSFKAFDREVLRSLAKTQAIDGGMYDIEYLYAARRAGLRIEKRRVIQREEKRASKINVKKAMVLDPRDLARIKAGGITGRYRAVSRR